MVCGWQSWSTRPENKNFVVFPVAEYLDVIALVSGPSSMKHFTFCWFHHVFPSSHFKFWGTVWTKSTKNVATKTVSRDFLLVSRMFFIGYRLLCYYDTPTFLEIWSHSCLLFSVEVFEVLFIETHILPNCGPGNGQKLINVLVNNRYKSNQFRDYLGGSLR